MVRKMKFYLIIQLISGFVMLLSCSTAPATCDAGGWSKPLFEFLTARLDVLQKARPFRYDNTDVPFEKIEALIQSLKKFQGKTKPFLKAPLLYPERPNECFNLIAKLPTKRSDDLLSLVNSNILSDNTMARGTEIEDRIKKKIEERLKTGDNTSDYILPLQEICDEIPANVLKKEITITDLCPNVDSCATEEYPYGISSYEGDQFTAACTSDNKCNIASATIMMAGVFWYKVDEWFVHRLCPQACKEGVCNVEQTYHKIIQENKHLRAFFGIIPNYLTSKWRTFFEDAVEYKAYLNLGQALAMVQQQESLFEVMPTACNDLLLTDACPYSDIYKEYVTIKRVQQYTKDKTSLSFVRDLRNLPNINLQERLKQEQNTYQHIELLGTLTSIDENLEASVSGISEYFQGLATYDKGIAEADMLFIQGELDKYEAELTKVETQIKEDVKEIMKKMMVVAAANLGEACILLALKVTENSNPLKLLFNGPDLAEIYDATGAVANAATEVAKGAALLIALNGLAEDSLKMSEAFLGNRGQITGLKEVVDKIRQNQADDIGKDADTFLQAYSAYTPQTDRSKLEVNNALWSAFKDATCDILSGDVGIAGATAKGIVGGKLLCERLEGTLAQFFTLREDIFDFQFQLVDAVAAVIRGNIAKRFGENIKGKGDVLHASQIMIGSFKMHNRFQSTASMFCDILEYQQNGNPAIEECSTVNGLYGKLNLDKLIEHSFTAPTNVLDRDVYIPTQASFKGDTGYIDLAALARGEKVVFKPPMNRDWLLENGWITSKRTTDMPFVSELKLCLPQKEYKTGADRQLTTTTIRVKSIASSYVSIEPIKKNIAYILPRRHTTFETVYEEGYTSCSAKEIDNPYSLCDNLPKICDQSSTIEGSLSLYPTILLTWILSYETMQGTNELRWDAPKPATNLLIKATVKLLFTRTKKSQSRLSKLTSRSDATVSEDGCCDGNNFRISRFNNTCVPCPENSTSHLRGYYCEIDEDTEGGGSGGGNEGGRRGGGNKGGTEGGGSGGGNEGEGVQPDSS